MLRIAICDDCAADRELLNRELKRLMAELPAELLSFPTGEALLHQISATGYCPNIAFLDIEFDGNPEDGIDLARKLQQQLPGCQIVFVTEHLARAMDVYRTEHAYFVLKSGMDTYLPLALAKAKERLQGGNRPSLLVEQKGKKLLLHQQDILYLERILRTTQIHCAKQIYSVGEKLDSIAERLDDTAFVRCHTSYLCNLEQVCELRRTEFILHCGQAIPISRHYYEHVKQRLACYLGGAM